jgi:hypothetical protein
MAVYRPLATKRPINFCPGEIPSIHADSKSYGGGAVLNENPACQARGFGYDGDRRQHIMWKDTRAVRHNVESSMPHMWRRNVLPHDDKPAFIASLTKLSSRSPGRDGLSAPPLALFDVNDITIRPCCIRSAADMWADMLSTEQDYDDL